MSFKLRYIKGIIPFEYSFEEIKEHLESHMGFGDFTLTDFIDSVYIVLTLVEEC